MLSSILVATDFSTRSEQAVARAVQLAKKHSVKVFLAHIIDDDQPKRIITAQTKVATLTIEDMAKELTEAEGISCTGLIKAGTPHITLAKLCEEVGANLLIIGPHRKHFLKDAFVGTTAERTIKYADCPILVANAKASKSYQKALFATDFSEGAAKACTSFVNLGIVSAENTILYNAFAIEEPIEENFSKALTASENGLKEFAKKYNLEASKLYGEALEASIPGQILSAVKNENADLVVVGARGKTGTTAEHLEQAFFGSIAKGVVSTASVDVLITR